jgi:hypothetical protein
LGCLNRDLIDVVARIEGGSIEHWAYEKGTWFMENLGGNAASAPAISSWDPERVDVFVRGTDGSLDQKVWEPGTGWDAWGQMPGPHITSGPDAYSWNPNRIDIVAQVAGGSVQHWSYER